MAETTRLSTTLIHHPYRAPEGFSSPQLAVHKASTVLFPDVAALRQRDWKDKTGYTYGLHGTPTTFTLEERIATLEGGLQTLLLPSGLAAITLVDTALLRSGDEVLIPDNAYGPGKELARHELAKWGISHRIYDPADPQGLADMIGAATRLVWFEAPGSVTMEFPDLAELINAAKSRGVICAIDNTWGAGIAFNAFSIPAVDGSMIGADVVMQALTKYPSGGGDVLMGSVTTRDPDFHLRLKATHMRMGWGVGANDAEAVLRALPSLELRYAAQDASARQVARWLRARPEVAQVLHPAFEGSPGHAHWKRTCECAAGLFSIVFDGRYTGDQVDAFLNNLQLFKLGYSWAGPLSLVVPYNLGSLRGKAKWAGTLVRFSIGLEAPDDLIADLDAALAKTFAQVGTE
jgi:cysteine-S-conjugate beta-lyase